MNGRTILNLPTREKAAGERAKGMRFGGGNRVGISFWGSREISGNTSKGHDPLLNLVGGKLGIFSSLQRLRTLGVEL